MIRAARRCAFTSATHAQAAPRAAVRRHMSAPLSLGTGDTGGLSKREDSNAAADPKGPSKDNRGFADDGEKERESKSERGRRYLGVCLL